MSIVFPKNRKEVSDRMKTDVQSELPESNPFLRNSFLGALIIGFAGRIFEFYLQLKQTINMTFPDTAKGEYLERWGSYVAITRRSATQSIGYCTVEGTIGDSIPVDTELQSSDGNTYKTTNDTVITDVTISITDLEKSGETAIATTNSNHFLADGIDVTISGATETEYNGTFTVNVTSEKTFTYDITGTPTSPATGTILCNHVTSSFEIESELYGEDKNLDSGTVVTFSSSISGINTDAHVQFSEIKGGTDSESDDDYRKRVTNRYQKPVAHFNNAEVENLAKEVSGVTRVWVEDITPEVGQGSILFVRDNDKVIIPTPSQVAEVKAKILTNKPIEMADKDVIVKAPNPKSVDFIFTELDPNTGTMQESIKNSLKEFFTENTNPGETLSRYSYTSAIYNTIDETTGELVHSFKLSKPTGDIPTTFQELPVLGDITYNIS